MKLAQTVQETNPNRPPAPSENSRNHPLKIDCINVPVLILLSIRSLSIKLIHRILTFYGVIALLLLFGIPAVAPQRTHKLFWDDKNPVFNHGNNKMIVEEGDDITIICPYNSPEHNNIYWSKKRDVYDQCDHTFDQSSIKLITCEPYSTKEFNFQVTRFSWVSLNPTFLPGKPIYLMSQSNFCQRYNMRIVVILKTNENKAKLKEAAAPERVVQPNNRSSHPLLWAPMILVSLALLIPWS